MRRAAGRFLPSLLGALAVAVSFSLYQIHSMPGRLMSEHNARALERAGGPNRFLHKPPADASWTEFVRPCPDLMYSHLVFDTQPAPLAVELPGHDDYWVLQMVADNTDSFAYIGDRTEENRPARLILLSDRTPACGDLPEGYRIFRSPSPTGTLLLRYLVRSPESAERIDRLRESIRAYPLECAPAK